MAFNLNTFRSKLVAGGARNNQFEIILTPPGYVNFPTEQFSVMAKATGMPESTVSPIDVPYFGRVIKVGGDRSFNDWNCTVINDETFDLRNAFERWSSSIAVHTTNTEDQRNGGATANPYSYVAKALVNQFGKEGNVVKTYELVNVWPIQIGPITLSWEQNNTIEEFDVVFAYDYFINNSVL